MYLIKHITAKQQTSVFKKKNFFYLEILFFIKDDNSNHDTAKPIIPYNQIEIFLFSIRGHVRIMCVCIRMFTENTSTALQENVGINEFEKTRTRSQLRRGNTKSTQFQRKIRPVD